MLAVVQHDQDVLEGQGIEQAVQDGPARLLADPQDLRNGRGNRFPVEDRGHLHQPDPIAGPVEQFGGHLEGQPGLACPAGPGQRDQAGGSGQGPDFCQLPVTADEGRQLGREIVRQRRVAERAQRREFGSQARRLQLEDPLRASQVLQPVDTQVPQRRARRKRVANQGRRRLREDDLPAVRDGCQPGGAMDVQAHETSGRPGRLTGVDPHPYPDVLPAGPGPGREGPLYLDRRRHAGRRRREHGEERVPLGIDFLTAVSGKTRPDQRVMVGKDLRVLAFPQALQQRRRALDVGEEERESLHEHSVKGPAGLRYHHRGRTACRWRS